MPRLGKIREKFQDPTLDARIALASEEAWKAVHRMQRERLIDEAVRRASQDSTSWGIICIDVRTGFKDSLPLGRRPFMQMFARQVRAEFRRLVGER